MKQSKARFITMTCVDLIDQFDLIYSFDINDEMIHYRVKAEKDRPFPSVTGVYTCAFPVENEIQDQFGLRFDGLHPDYDGHFILSRDAPVTPMLRKTEVKGKNIDAV